ncbi:tetratricopeptide repeat protein [Tahibacter aquaticus]|uniref:Tetratricopeptide repeat protein n=1 Tax=Tahibacter aquaticus TaxID=520092 RepID=A0A4R6YV21_9GAMM|nr:tetratricopeptide repeat protein [Tahibacter aquaticus]TDR42452.1 tetratricopeptide repeat protein [Tahibacter aquaticus]
MSARFALPELTLPATGPGTLTIAAAAAGDARDSWLRAAVAQAAPAAAVHHLDCRLRLGGPWAGLADYLQALLPQIDAAAPDLLQRHRYELAQAVPSLRSRFPLSEASLTDASPVKERVRSYPVDRAYRLLHGLIELLDEWLPQAGRRQVLVLHHFDETSLLMRRFFHDLVRRRLAALPLDLVVAVAPANALDVAAKFDAGTLQHIEAALAPGSAAPDMAALRAQAQALEEQVNRAMGRADNLLPRLIDLLDSLGEHAQAQRWRSATLALYNHYGLYEDALFFGEPILADLDEIDQGERRFGRWNIVSGLFNAYAALGRPEDALAVVRDEAMAKISEPNDLISIYYTMAMLYCRFLPRRDFALAEEYLHKSMALIDVVTLPEAEKHYLAVFNLNGVAFIRFQQGRIAEAAELCREGYERLEKHLGASEYRLHRSVLLYNIAQVYSATRAYDEAIAYYSQAMELDPRYSEYYNERGGVYLKVGRLDEAVRDFHEAIRLSAPYFEVWTNLGQAYRRMGNATAAVEAYSHALDIEPAAALARIGRAEAHAQLGQVDAALADYGIALTRDPADAQLWSNRAVLLYEAGRVTESLHDLDEAVQRAPSLPDLYENRAIALASLQRHEEAQRDRDYALHLQAAAA